MSVQLSAPHPQNQTTTILPNPVWDDSVNLKDSLSIKRASDGTMFTYVKSAASRRRLVMSFDLTLYKGMELQAFLRTYYASRLYIQDHLGSQWVGYAVGNPFEFETSERGSSGGGGESMNVQLELEVVPLGSEGDL
jgi:hypothetical protein